MLWAQAFLAFPSRCGAPHMPHLLPLAIVSWWCPQGRASPPPSRVALRGGRPEVRHGRRGSLPNRAVILPVVEAARTACALDSPMPGSWTASLESGARLRRRCCGWCCCRRGWAAADPSAVQGCATNWAMPSQGGAIPAIVLSLRASKPASLWIGSELIFGDRKTQEREASRYKKTRKQCRNSVRGNPGVTTE
jgi:hypothetical protein